MRVLQVKKEVQDADTIKQAGVCIVVEGEVSSLRITALRIGHEK